MRRWFGCRRKEDVVLRSHADHVEAQGRSWSAVSLVLARPGSPLPASTATVDPLAALCAPLPWLRIASATSARNAGAGTPSTRGCAKSLARQWAAMATTSEVQTKLATELVFKCMHCQWLLIKRKHLSHAGEAKLLPKPTLADTLTCALSERRPDTNIAARCPSNVCCENLKLESSHNSQDSVDAAQNCAHQPWLLPRCMPCRSARDTTIESCAFRNPSGV